MPDRLCPLSSRFRGPDGPARSRLTDSAPVRVPLQPSPRVTCDRTDDGHHDHPDDDHTDAISAFPSAARIAQPAATNMADSSKNPNHGIRSVRTFMELPMTSGVPRGVPSPSRIGLESIGLWCGDWLASPPGVAGGAGEAQAVQRHLDRPDRQATQRNPPRDGPPIWGRGTRASLAIVLRVTNGMLGAVASLAPDPMLIVGPAIPPHREVPVPASPGFPVKFSGSMLEIPPEPMMENDVGIAYPPTEPPAYAPAPGQES